MGTAANYDFNIEIVSDAEGIARRCVDVFVDDAKTAIETKGVFNVAVSGGRTPRRFFELLGCVPESKALPWDRIHIFWVDERYVPPDSEWSNFKLAAETFLDKVGVPDSNIHPIPTEFGDFSVAARSYENTIRRVFGIIEDRIPRFDLIVLGMGADGHIASLFPDCYACLDASDLACVVYLMDEKHDRITLTYPVIRAASHVTVLVSGKEKSKILKEVFTSEPDDVRYPVHMLWPILDRVTWLVDTDAAQAI
ncbi:MAG: 6-phosphogluconolactonase [Sedimentisphaerales bacterium]|nr:6-phosphogluconolactonase [Sedimentisphaerales bacterium]